MIKTATIDGLDFELIRDHATKAWFNGRSHIRGSDREESGLTDQIVGQLGEYSIARFFGRKEDYFERRKEINKTPYRGDGGLDLPGGRIDVKSSLMRRSQDPFSYNLLVRPAERHPDTYYVLCLVTDLTTESARVILVGYAMEHELPTQVEEGGVFAGAYKLSAKKLHDLNELKGTQNGDHQRQVVQLGE